MLFADFFNYIMNLDGDMVPRHLQAPALTYTSPPLPVAIDATPESHQSDIVIDSLRSAASAGNCTAETMHCHIPFHVPEDAFEGDSTVGIIIYGGGAVDPRSYSVLARLLTTRYGLPSVIPVFANDLAFDFIGCDTGRIQLAAAEFPNVKQWVLVGHSFGGVGASYDLWARQKADDASAVAGLVLLAADVAAVPTCGPSITFSDSDLPMASLVASNDLILNMTRYEENLFRLPNATTQFMDILGGNHGGFAAYDASGRLENLGQTDGVATIPQNLQWDFTVSSIASVVSRAIGPDNMPVPVLSDEGDLLPPSDTSAACFSRGNAGGALACTLLWSFLALRRHLFQFIDSVDSQ